MYEQYFNLREKPFQMQPDPDFIFWSEAHSMAYSMLEYGILNNAGFTVVTGEVGSGKTTLIRILLGQLLEHATVALLSNTSIAQGDLLRWVMLSFGQRFDQTSQMALFQDFQNFLISEFSKGKRSILIVDEAQNLSATTLEELRMLSNINADKDQLLQIILVGQPQLRDVLQAPNMLQFIQRITSDFHLVPLKPPEVAHYISHRLIMAGGNKELFSHMASRLVADASGGVPRTINMLCDTALVYAFSAAKSYVSSALMSQVIADKQKYGVFFKPAPSRPA
jgi:general secretion pathway protein A